MRVVLIVILCNLLFFSCENAESVRIQKIDLDGQLIGEWLSLPDDVVEGNLSAVTFSIDGFCTIKGSTERVVTSGNQIITSGGRYSYTFLYGGLVLELIDETNTAINYMRFDPAAFDKNIISKFWDQGITGFSLNFRPDQISFIIFPPLIPGGNSSSQLALSTTTGGTRLQMFYYNVSESSVKELQFTYEIQNTPAGETLHLTALGESDLEKRLGGMYDRY